MQFIFNKSEGLVGMPHKQLPEGELRGKIEQLASSLKFPLKKLFVIDGSTRSSHSNVTPSSLTEILSFDWTMVKLAFQCGGLDPCKLTLRDHSQEDWSRHVL
jgi:hypothetical protein